MQQLPIETITYGRKAAVAPGQLIEAHLPLVRKLAWHVRGMAPGVAEVEDLIQIGMVALVECANHYEDRGHGFATYASMRIRGALIDHLRASSNMCRSAMDFRKKVRRAQELLVRKLARDPSEAEIAEALGMDAADFRMRSDAAQDVRFESMDEVYSEHSMWFADGEDSAETVMEADNLKQLLNASIATLKEREQLILQLHYIEEMNLDEIGLVLGITAARVCQIKKTALEKLRKRLASTR
ncbi:sigma-70 family RNA polymerase sigma factor [Blastomonas sp.]|uniref:sigma-70 family RNA polymerase sigma factor n=1 Tax=Blastomonas sp. TaxID=1909299 RepID=UPI0035931939